MRKVANHLGVQLNTVYWHADQPALLAAMADLMLESCADQGRCRNGGKTGCVNWRTATAAQCSPTATARIGRRNVSVESRTLQLGGRSSRHCSQAASNRAPRRGRPGPSRTTPWASRKSSGHCPRWTSQLRLADAVRPDRYPALARVAEFFRPADFDQRFDFRARPDDRRARQTVSRLLGQHVDGVELRIARAVRFASAVGDLARSG